MINKLTPEQELEIPKYYQKYLAEAYKVGKTDEAKAEASFREIYKLTNQKAPKVILWFDSPMACQMATHLLKNSQLGSQLGSQLHSQLSSQLYSQLDSQLYSQLYSQLGSQLYSQLYSQLRSQLRSQKIIKVYGFEALRYLSYLGFYSFISEQLLPKASAPLLKPFEEAAKNCFEWFAFEGLIIACRKLVNIELNAEKQLHALNKPAIEFADGWGVYCLNGEVRPDYECTELGQILYT